MVTKATDYTATELMIIVAARQLQDGERVLVGVGQPNLACNLARRLQAPNLVMIYEAGVVGARPARLPLSIGDPCLVSGSQLVCSMVDLFAFYLQAGWVDVGFLGGAQIDRWGNINATVIGDYHQPKVRLPGSGGACDIATLAGKVLILTPHHKRRFPEEVDFVTSPGYVDGREGRRKLGLAGGPEAVITDLCILGFDQDGEMELRSLHPGVTVDQVQAQTGWALKVASPLECTAAPTAEELRILREELDPEGIYLGR